MPQKVHSPMSVSLIPTVCGAVKYLQDRTQPSKQVAHSLLDTNDLKREGLKLAKDAMRRAMSKKVLEMTSTGTFRLKELSEDTRAYNRLPKKQCPTWNKKKPSHKRKLRKRSSSKKSSKPKPFKKCSQKQKDKFKRITELMTKDSRTLHKIVRDKMRSSFKRTQKKNKVKPNEKQQLTAKASDTNLLPVNKLVTLNNQNGGCSTDPAGTELYDKANSVPAPSCNGDLFQSGKRKRKAKDCKTLKQSEPILNGGDAENIEATPPLKKRLRRRENFLSIAGDNKNENNKGVPDNKVCNSE